MPIHLLCLNTNPFYRGFVLIFKDSSGCFYQLITKNVTNPVIDNANAEPITIIWANSSCFFITLCFCFV